MKPQLSPQRFKVYENGKLIHAGSSDVVAAKILEGKLKYYENNHTDFDIVIEDHQNKLRLTSSRKMEIMP